MKIVFMGLLFSFATCAIEPEQANSWYEQAQYRKILTEIDQQPTLKQNPDLIAIYIQAMFNLRQREEANTLLNQLIIEYPQHSELLYLAGINKIVLASDGNIFNARQRTSDGLQLLMKAVTVDPKNYPAQHALISFYQSAPPAAGGSKRLATEQAILLAGLDPLQGALAEIQLLILEARLSEAVALIDKHLQQMPKQADLLATKASILARQDAYLVAQQLYSETAKFSTKPTQRYNALYQVGRLAVLNNNNVLEGITALSEYIGYYKDSEQSRLNWAKLRLVQLFMLSGSDARAELLFADIANTTSADEDFMNLKDQVKVQLTTDL
jgi:tetratricopeptide (TPR) repeat protein